MKPASFHKISHDAAAWCLRVARREVRRVDQPLTGHGQAEGVVQAAGSRTLDNRFARELFPAEPATTSFDWPEARVWRLEHVRLVGLAGHVFFPDGTLWSLSARDARGPRGKVRPPLPLRESRLRQPVVHLCGMNPENRGHFMMEVLPRLEAFLRFRPEAAGWKFLVPAGHARWQARFFAAYGIHESQVVEKGPGTALADQVWFVPFLNGVDKLAEPGWHQAVRTRWVSSVPSDSGGGPALLVSRRDAPNKRVENEDEVAECMEKILGSVDRVTLSGMPLTEQVRKFRAAPVIVGGFGQGLVNTQFAEGATVIVLTSSTYHKKPSWPRAFQQLAQVSGNRAACLLGPDRLSPNANYRVDIRAFCALLERVRLLGSN